MVASRSKSPFPSEASLSDVEAAVIELFVHVAHSFGFQKSIGQIYGLLFSTAEPLHLDGIAERLALSKGSVSQGLRTLKSLGAVQLVLVPGERRDHFGPEIRLRKLVGGILTNQVSSALDNGADRLEQIEELLDENTDDAVKMRLGKLANWHGKFETLIPMVKAFVGRE